MGLAASPLPLPSLSPLVLSDEPSTSLACEAAAGPADEDKEASRVTTAVGAPEMALGTISLTETLGSSAALALEQEQGHELAPQGKSAVKPALLLHHCDANAIAPT